MFRYERPQKGRYRQFHQIGVELIGIAEPLADAEVIALGADILSALGLSDRVVLELNSLGDGESRSAYRDVLVDYFRSHRQSLSEDSLLRLERNPLRILDSKDEGDRAVVADAPLITDSLNEASREFFDEADRFSRPRRGRPIASIRDWSGDWTTTAIRRSSSPPMPWGPRGRCWPEDATTA